MTNETIKKLEGDLARAKGLAEQIVSIDAELESKPAGVPELKRDDFPPKASSQPGSRFEDLSATMLVERYKFITAKQTYYTDLARSLFEQYIKVLMTVVGAGVAVFAAFARFEIEIAGGVVATLLAITAVLVVAFAGGTSAGISFCENRWKGFRDSENQLAAFTNIGVPASDGNSEKLSTAYHWTVWVSTVLVAAGLSWSAHHVKSLAGEVPEAATSQVACSAAFEKCEAARAKQRAQDKTATANGGSVGQAEEQRDGSIEDDEHHE